MASKGFLNIASDKKPVSYLLALVTAIIFLPTYSIYLSILVFFKQ